jgi:catechol 2,3-dioxygenase-like lactoylglutathione lyase family enzyme
MLVNARLTAFIPVTDIERSRNFYVDTLGCGLVESTPYACVLVVGGSELRLAKIESFEPLPTTVLGFEVGDVHAEAESLGAKGVHFLDYAGIEQDDAGVWHVPGGGEVAWFLDPDGNTLSIQRTVN